MMAREQRGGGGGGGGGGRRQEPVRGFRPGKEPAQLRKQRVKEQIGEGNWAQQKLIDTLADRTPQEARQMMGRWRTGALVAAVVLTALAVLLFLWSIFAGIAMALIATAAFVIWFRLRTQQASFEALADIVSRQGGKAGKGRR